jgi:hypothetical protein
MKEREWEQIILEWFGIRRFISIIGEELEDYIMIFVFFFLMIFTLQITRIYRRNIFRKDVHPSSNFFQL